MKLIKYATLCAMLISASFTYIGCSHKKKDNSLALLLLSNAAGGSATVAIQPDGPYTGSDCSCGIKSSEGSTMSVAYTTSASFKAKSSSLSQNYVPGEIIVKFKKGVSQTRASNLMTTLKAAGFSNLYKLKRGGSPLFKHVKISPKQNLQEAIARYNADPDVEYAQPNYIYHATAITPNDPDYSYQWGLNNTGQSVNSTTGTSDRDIDAPEAWSTRTDCSSVIVAVLDTGINYNHRDLTNNMWDGGGSYPNHGYDFVDDDDDPMDLNGHGTHCAGIIGASGDDSTGLCGVCWSVQLMAIRVLDATGTGTTATITQGIQFAVDNNVHVISASIGGSSSDSAMLTAINNARTKGIILVAAAGNEASNDDTTPVYPASYDRDNIISVAAVDQNGDLASFSNYGTTSVDIAAPGVNILSTWPGQSVTTRESFGSDWVKEAGWGTGTYTYTGPSGNLDITMLTNPSPFGGSNTYANDLESAAYKAFDLDVYGADSATVSLWCDINTEEYYDGVYFAYNTSGQRPNSSNSLNAWSGDYGGLGWAGEYDLTPYLSAERLSLGFLFSSDFALAYSGIGVGYFDMTRLYHNTTACHYSSGTSMATPYVTGVVALAIAQDMAKTGYTPTSEYDDIITYIKNGADHYASLDGKVDHGRMLNAKGAIDLVPLL